MSASRTPRSTVLNRDPARYTDEGYCLLKGVVPKDALPRLREDILACIAETKESAWYARAKSRLYREFSAGLHMKKRSIADLLRSEPFGSIGRGILGPDFDLRFTTTMTKTAERSSGLDWHQDSGYDADPEHLKFSWWIAVTDSNRANGCLRIIPGTHKQGLVKHVLSRRFPPDKEIETVDENGALDVEMDAGDALLLDPFVFHASWPNESGALRIGLLAGFMRPKAEYLEHERQGSYAYMRGGEPRWEPVRWDAAWPFRI